MDTTRTDHSPNNPSHPTPRARDLRERLDSAADEGLSQNISRFLRFLGHEDGDVIELQTLGVPSKYAPTTHFTHAKTVEKAIDALEYADEREPTGSYILFNAVDPAVATRAASGAWHVAKRGESTTDRDVRARRALYIDVDAERTSGTSATDDELGHAVAKAADILAWLEERVPPAAIGVGHSGNGASLFVALGHLAERPELALSVKALLAGLDHRFSDARAKVDRSVSDAKRLCPAFGTTKRKGAAGIAERPHRRTAFVCADQVERLDEAALTTLVQSLRDELDDEGRALMDRELGVVARAPAATASARVTAANACQVPRTTSPFALANAVPVADVVAWLGLDEGDGHVRCPGCGEVDKGVAIVGNGLKCQHARCAGKGVRAGFRSVVDLVMEVRGVDAKQAVELLAARFGFASFGEGERRGDAAQSPLPASINATLPSIIVNDRQHRDLIDDARRAVVASNPERLEKAMTALPKTDESPPLFVRAGQVVRLTADEDGPRLKDVGDATMYGVLVRVANWLRVTRDEETVSVAPPGDVPRDLLTFPPRDLPEIEGIVTTPVFGKTGTLVTTPGYHASERVWLHVDRALGPLGVPASPNAANVAFARDLLLHDLMVDFPFVADGDRAHALAAMLLPFARRLIDGPTPLHVFEAPAAGSGKGLLVKAIAIVATGAAVESRSLSPVEEECRKMLTAELAGGKQLILLDNVSEKRVLDSPPLAAMLTSDVWRDRVLGETRMVSLPNRALWLMSGNNSRFSLEIARRCVRIRIDAKQDMPWRRAGFKHDPLSEWVIEQRGLLVRACLVLVQAWLAAGRPRGRARLGSFESWASVMGGILDVAGVPGFLGNADDFYATSDAEGEAWRELVALWWERSGTAPMRVADLNALCAERELFEDLRGDGTERSQQTKLGKALQASRDRVCMAKYAGHKGRSYALERVEPAQAAGSRARGACAESGRVRQVRLGTGQLHRVNGWPPVMSARSRPMERDELSHRCLVQVAGHRQLRVVLKQRDHRAHAAVDLVDGAIFANVVPEIPQPLSRAACAAVRSIHHGVDLAERERDGSALHGERRAALRIAKRVHQKARPVGLPGDPVVADGERVGLARDGTTARIEQLQPQLSLGELQREAVPRVGGRCHRLDRAVRDDHAVAGMEHVRVRPHLAQLGVVRVPVQLVAADAMVARDGSEAFAGPSHVYEHGQSPIRVSDWPFSISCATPK